MSAPLIVRSALLAAYPHGFTSRSGGVSLGGLSSLNLALRENEEPERLCENWRRVVQKTEFSGSIEDVAILNQVHGDCVLHVDKAAGVLQTVGEADAAVTTRRDIMLAVRTADCVPVLLASPGAVGVAHAGWRGVAAEVVPRAVEALCEASGDSPSEVKAVIGPHISQAAYEVGTEVVAGIAATGVPEVTFVQTQKKPHVCLASAVRYQLEQMGVALIESVRVCTFNDSNFFSHRRDGPSTGRLAGVIARPRDDR